MPSLFRMAFFWGMKLNPHWFKKLSGTVVVTSVGMFGGGGGWGITFLPLHTLGLTLGGIAQKPGVVGGKIEIREYLDLNLTRYPEEVYLQIGLSRFHAHAQVIRDRQELKRILTRFSLDSPTDAHSMMGWDATRDDAATSDFSLMMEHVLIVRFDKC